MSPAPDLSGPIAYLETLLARGEIGPARRAAVRELIAAGRRVLSEQTPPATFAGPAFDLGPPAAEPPAAADALRAWAKELNDKHIGGPPGPGADQHAAAAVDGSISYAEWAARQPRHAAASRP